MLSTELPVTDWWDPEWEVYDVPISPDNVPHDVWWPAYFHQAMIEYITTGRTWGWPDGILTRQLTTGHDPLCPSITAGWECDCRDDPLYPGPWPWPWPCSCEYVVFDCPWPARWAIASGFRIHSDCPQHGDDAHA